MMISCALDKRRGFCILEIYFWNEIIIAAYNGIFIPISNCEWQTPRPMYTGYKVKHSNISDHHDQCRACHNCVVYGYKSYLYHIGRGIAIYYINIACLLFIGEYVIL